MPVLTLFKLKNFKIPSSNCGFAAISPVSLPNAAAGTAYSQTFTPAAQLYSGTLPGGLTISNGTLSGVPTQTGTFSFVVGTTLNPGFNPQGCAASRYYTLTVTGPTAAAALVSGRVLTAEGRGVPGASIEMFAANGDLRYARTNSFGYFRFNDVEAGETYIFQVKHKAYMFEPQVITINDGVSNLNFKAR